MFDFGFWELALAVLVALVVVGPKKLPGLAAQVGHYVGRIKRMAGEFRRQLESDSEWKQLSETVEEQKQAISRLQTDIGRTHSPDTGSESGAENNIAGTSPNADAVETAVRTGRYIPDPELTPDENEPTQIKEPEKPERD